MHATSGFARARSAAMLSEERLLGCDTLVGEHSDRDPFDRTSSGFAWRSITHVLPVEEASVQLQTWLLRLFTNLSLFTPVFKLDS